MIQNIFKGQHLTNYKPFIVRSLSMNILFGYVFKKGHAIEIIRVGTIVTSIKFVIYICFDVSRFIQFRKNLFA